MGLEIWFGWLDVCLSMFKVYIFRILWIYNGEFMVGIKSRFKVIWVIWNFVFRIFVFEKFIKKYNIRKRVKMLKERKKKKDKKLEIKSF